MVKINNIWLIIMFDIGINNEIILWKGIEEIYEKDVIKVFGFWESSKKKYNRNNWIIKDEMK